MPVPKEAEAIDETIARLAFERNLSLSDDVQDLIREAIDYQIMVEKYRWQDAIGALSERLVYSQKHRAPF